MVKVRIATCKYSGIMQCQHELSLYLIISSNRHADLKLTPPAICKKLTLHYSTLRASSGLNFSLYHYCLLLMYYFSYLIFRDVYLFFLSVCAAGYDNSNGNWGEYSNYVNANNLQIMPPVSASCFFTCSFDLLLSK